MKRNLSAAGIAILLVSCCIGCASEDYALRAITLGLNPGRTDLMWYPSGPEMVQSGRLSLHQVIPAPDKTPIDVWVIKARDAQGQPVPAAGTVLVLHQLSYGKGSFPYIGMGERLAGKGYDVVLPDLRAHGRSGGQHVTFGAKEKDDLKSVMDKLIADQAVSDKVYVFGAGLGACVGIQYAAIDPRVQGVVAVAPYKDFRSYARQGAAIMTDAEFQKVLEAAGRIGDFKPEEASAVEAARKLTRPLLLIHGTLDFSVPLEWSQAILDAAGGPKKLQVVNALELPVVGALYEDWLVAQVLSLRNQGRVVPETRPAAATRPDGNG